MKLRSLAASATAIVTGVLGLCLVDAGPAAAATGSWRAYHDTNPIKSSTAKWVCGATSPITDSVSAQPCVIRSANGYSVQAAAIVHNRGASNWGAYASVELWKNYTRLNTWDCAASAVGARSWSVCFGQTQTDYAEVFASADLNGSALGATPPV